MVGNVPPAVKVPDPCWSSETLPLIHFVDADDEILRACEEAEWFRVLDEFPWWEYQELGAAYYEALWDYNAAQAEQRRERQWLEKVDEESESKEAARLRLLFGRPTGGNDLAPLLHENPVPETSGWIDPRSIRPGVTPPRFAGRQPKCFFGLFKAFVGVSLMGRAPEPEEVHDQLLNNPAFARVCGFTPRKANGTYHQSAVPSLRKLEQFDQIMTNAGLWEQAKWAEVDRNLEKEVIHPEKELVHDTTHYPAYSSFETVEWTGAQGGEHRKSQSRLTKSCTCTDKEQCSHEWVLRDEGAGTVVKGGGQMHWAHKASVVALPRQGVPVDAVAMTDAASHDSNSLVPHLRRLCAEQPEWVEVADYLLDDSAADEAALRELLAEEFGLTLRTGINPRSRKAITGGLPRGMGKLTPYGELLCLAEQTLEYLSVRWETGVFNYGPPRTEAGESACLTCPLKEACCPRATQGRRVTIPFDLLPHVDPHDPPMAKRFQAMMTHRPAVERVIKRLKYDVGDPHLTKRGNATFQARLNKTLLAFHLLLRQ